MGTESLECLFERLTDSWIEETWMHSSTSTIMNNNNCKQLIGLGESILPLIFEKYKNNLSMMWDGLLYEILGEAPDIPEKHWGKVFVIREYWIEWGKEKGYIINE